MDYPFGIGKEKYPNRSGIYVVCICLSSFKKIWESNIVSQKDEEEVVGNESEDEAMATTN